MTVDSEKNGIGKDPGDLKDSKKDKKEKKSSDNDKSSNGSTISELFSNLKNFVVADDLNIDKATEKLENKANENPNKSSKQESKSDNTSDQNDNSENQQDNPFNFSDVLGHDSVSSLKTRKDSIIKGTALVVGGILILYGLVLITTSVTRVADNVIFGEKAMLSTFLILLGVLIIVAAFAQRILNRTFLNKIHTELEVAEGKPKVKSTVSKDNSKKIEDENHNNVGKDNKDKDNKDNIVGENKDNHGG